MSGVLHGVLAAIAGARDTFFRYVSLLLNTTSTNGAQNNTFLDDSTNAFSITRNGNTTQGNFSPFSQTGWSNYFDGNGDYFTVANNAALNMGANSFTLEAFIYLTATPGAANPYGGVIIDKDGLSGTSWPQYALSVDSNRKAVFQASSVPNVTTPTAVITGATTLALGTWYHIAVTRVGTAATLWVNGISDGTTSAVPATLNSATRALFIGWADRVTPDATFNFPGYISNLRIVNGTAVYTATFTPPTAPLTAITNTSLLTCQSNRFIDNSSNAFAITRNGDVSVQAFSPFAPTAAWSASANGGSGYFDGAGDYLEVADNTAFDLGSGDFTVETFVYLSSLPASNARYNIFGQWGPNPGANDLAYIGQLFNDAGTMKITLDWSTTGTTATGVSITASVVAAAWLHIAWVRSGTSLRIFLNGTEVTSGNTITGTLWNSSRPLNIGRNEAGNSNLLNGYLSNLRIVKGTAVYTANFTPPTAPLTAITNTSLLLNFTNAGIYDSASGNDLETVGNAQVSTVQAKWGTTSMAFDGTGDWLVQIDRPALRLGTAAFTIEMWVYRSASGTYGLISKGTSTTGWSVSLNASNQVVFSFAASSFNSTGTVAATTWTHIAVVREGTGASQTKIYINGTNDGTGTVATDFSGTDVMYVGADRVAGSAFNGYIDDLRITNGYARYTANFTAPTAAFPLQ